MCMTYISSKYFYDHIIHALIKHPDNYLVYTMVQKHLIVGYGVTLHPGTLLLTNSAATSALDRPTSFALFKEDRTRDIDIDLVSM